MAFQQGDGRSLRELALFAGAGGGILGGKLLGWRTVCAVEIEPGARAKLAARQNDGCLSPFPIWDDIRTFDGSFWRGRVDVVSGGFPCQDISVAGEGDGLDGERSGLWHEMRRVIGEVEPDFVFVENAPALTTRGGLRVVGDLTSLGYDCRWGIVSAADAIWLAGPPCLDHLRDRMWIFGARADADQNRRETWMAKGRTGPSLFAHAQSVRSQANEDANASSERHGITSGTVCPGRDTVELGGPTAADADCLREQQSEGSEQDIGRWIGDGGKEIANPAGVGQSGPGQVGQSIHPDGQADQPRNGDWWTAEPAVGRMAYGVADGVDRLKCIGNGQLPQVVRLAWNILKP